MRARWHARRAGVCCRAPPSPPPALAICTYHALPAHTQADELRAALERERSAFEAALAQRDTTLAALAHALGDADALHARAAGDHLGDVAGLEAMQATRLAALERDFAAALARVTDAFAADAAAADTRHGATVLQLQHLLAAVAADEAAKAAAAAAEHDQAREALKRRTLERIHVLQSDMDGAVEALEAAFEGAHLAYLQSTDSRTQDFKALSERGQADAAATEAQQRALRRLTRLLGAWRGKLAAAVREGEGRNGALAGERDALAAQLEALKAGMARARAATARRLSGLCVQAQGAKGVLATHLALAERTLALAAMLRPLHTEVELCSAKKLAHAHETNATNTCTAVTQWSDIDSSSSANTRGTTEAGKPTAAVHAHAHRYLPLAPGTADAVTDAVRLRGFYVCFNNVRASAAALADERARLQEEAATLRGLLQQYHDGAKAMPPVLVGARLQVTG